MICEFCHQPIKEGARFCRHCGRPTQTVDQAQPEETTPPANGVKTGANTKRLSLIIGSIALVAVACGAAITYMVMPKAKNVALAKPMSAPTPKTDTVQQIIKQSLPSVALITVNTADGQDLGTGFVCDTEGDVLTNAHVVNGGTTISVKDNDGNSYSGTIIGLDPVHDIALVRVPAMVHIQPLTLGDSKNVSLGDSVVAIGSPLGLKDTVTTGLISGLNRSFTIGSGDYHNMFQISAPIAPGNSGGPLLSQDNGAVIGINTAGSDTTGNIGFSIPIDQVKTLVSTWASQPESPSQVQSIMDSSSLSDSSDSSDDGTGSSSDGSDGSTDTTTESFSQNCIDAINTFYDDVNSKDYMDAYNLLGQSWQEGMSYASFSSGYSTTLSAEASDPVVVSSTDNTAEITFSVTAQTQNGDGTTTTTVYHMDYQFGMEDGQLRIEHGTSQVVG